jgi:hypothetical protein
MGVKQGWVQILPKLRYISTKLQGIASYQTIIFIPFFDFTRTVNLKQLGCLPEKILLNLETESFILDVKN